MRLFALLQVPGNRPNLLTTALLNTLYLFQFIGLLLTFFAILITGVFKTPDTSWIHIVEHARDLNYGLIQQKSFTIDIFSLTVYPSFAFTWFSVFEGYLLLDYFSLLQLIVIVLFHVFKVLDVSCWHLPCDDPLTCVCVCVFMRFLKSWSVFVRYLDT